MPMSSELLQKLANRTITKQTLYKAVAADFGLLPQVLNGVSSPEPSIRYGCGSVLVELSAKYPEKLYPHMDKFIALLESEYRILKWNALAVIANLCCVDVDKKFDPIFDKYFGFLNDEYMVTAANVADAAGKIALAKPYLIPKITAELLKVEDLAITPHLTKECRLVIAEHAIKSFDKFFEKMPQKEKANVVSFVTRQLESRRKPLRHEAERFLKGGRK
jgi:hypothetical protein